MDIIALFLPACITMSIRQQRGAGCEKKLFPVLLEYGKTVLWCNLLTMGVITYVLRVSDVQSDAFKSFPFFSKYVIIAMFFAFIMPYISEVIGRYIKIRFFVKEK